MVCDQEHPPARAQTENVLLLTFDDIPRMKSSDTPNPFYSFEAAEVLRRIGHVLVHSVPFQNGYSKMTDTDGRTTYSIRRRPAPRRAAE